MYEYKAIVTRVIDGDTIDVDIQLGFDVVLAKQRIRLLGIDTPESRTRDKEEKVRGLLSKEFVKNNCAVGSTIRRILGVIYSGDDTVSINDRMIEEGFAVPYTGGNKDELDALHEANKQKLIEKGLL